MIKLEEHVQFYRILNLIYLILFLACSPSANYQPMKKSQEAANSDNGNQEISQDSSSQEKPSDADLDKEDASRNKSESGKDSSNSGQQKEDENKKIGDNKGDNEESANKLAEVNYKAPSPYDYPNDYNNPNSDSIPTRHMLVWHETPSSEVLINWGVDEFNAEQEHMVFLSENQQNGIDPENNYELKFGAKESGLAETCDDEIHSNLQVKVTGLKPNTTYYYITRSNGQRSKEMHFVTAPSSNDVSFKILSGGDSRSQRDDRNMMNGIMKSMVNAEPNYIALVHGGDFINTGSSCTQWRNWRNDHQGTILENGRIIPLIATFGNHESTGTDGKGERIYKELFGDPQGEGNFYFLSTIGNLSLIILNSQISAEGDQQDWLQETLKSLKNKEYHLIVAGYHAPAWPANKKPARSTNWIDEFEDYQVNLVLESDGHTLKQTCPIMGKVCDPENGIIYVGEGGLGVRQRDAKNADEWYFNSDFGGYATSQLHVQSLSVTSTGNGPAKLTYEVYYDNSFNHKIELMSKDRKQLRNN